MKPTNKNTVAHFTQYLEENQAREKESIRVHKAIRTVLDKWNNKRITRRIVEQIKQAAYPGDEGVVVYYDEIASLLNIKIWGGTSGATYDTRSSYFLGYTGQPFAGSNVDKYVYAGTFKAESFEDSDACHGHAAEKRCKARQALLDNPEQIKELVEMIERTRQAYEAFSEFTHKDCMDELRYEAERVLGLELLRGTLTRTLCRK